MCLNSAFQVTSEDNLLKHQAMQKNSKRNNNSRVSELELNSVDTEKEKKEGQNNFFELLPLEVTLQIFSQLDMRSLCRASMTCKSWNDTIMINNSLWEPHCLAVRAVCKREIDDDLKSGYSWRVSLLFVVCSVLNNLRVDLNLLYPLLGKGRFSSTE